MVGAFNMMTSSSIAHRHHGVLNNGRRYESIVTATAATQAATSSERAPTGDCDKGAGPITLLAYLSTNFNHSSVADWTAKIRLGKISISGIVCRCPEQSIFVGDRIAYHRPPWEEPYYANGGRPPSLLPIIFEDANIVAIHKPSGLPVMPSSVFNECTVMAVLHRQFASTTCHNDDPLRADGDAQQQVAQKSPAQETPTPAHRLGVGTSGVLLCGKTKLGRRFLGGLFDCSGLDGGGGRTPKARKKARKKALARACGVQKVYLALCAGILEVRGCLLFVVGVV